MKYIHFLRLFFGIVFRVCHADEDGVYRVTIRSAWGAAKAIWL